MKKISVNKFYQPDLYFSEQIDVAGGTTTLQLGSDIVDLDTGDFRDVKGGDYENRKSGSQDLFLTR